MQYEDGEKSDVRERATTQGRALAGEGPARPTADELAMVAAPLRGRVTEENLEQVFTYHSPRSGREVVAYAEIRARAMDLAETILRLTPACADQQAALRKVREAMMTANAAIATQGAV